MLLIKDGKILLVKRRDDLEMFPGWYILPGGKQEAHEMPPETAIRETEEETGIKVSNPYLKIFATHFHEYKAKVFLVYIFVSSEFQGELRESKEGAPVWLPIEQALQEPKLYPDLKRHLKLILESADNQIIFTYHRYNEKLEITEAR